MAAQKNQFFLSEIEIIIKKEIELYIQLNIVFLAYCVILIPEIKHDIQFHK